jgi:hypothetical protein
MAYHWSTRRQAQLRLAALEQELAGILRIFPELRYTRAAVTRIAEARALLRQGGASRAPHRLTRRVGSKEQATP